MIDKASVAQSAVLELPSNRGVQPIFLYRCAKCGTRCGIDLAAEDAELAAARCPTCTGTLRPSPSLLDVLHWHKTLGGWRDYKRRAYHLTVCSHCFNVVAASTPRGNPMPRFACPVCRSRDIQSLFEGGEAF